MPSHVLVIELVCSARIPENLPENYVQSLLPPPRGVEGPARKAAQHEEHFGGRDRQGTVEPSEPASWPERDSVLQTEGTRLIFTQKSAESLIEPPAGRYMVHYVN